TPSCLWERAFDAFDEPVHAPRVLFGKHRAAAHALLAVAILERPREYLQLARHDVLLPLVEIGDDFGRNRRVVRRHLAVAARPESAPAALRFPLAGQHVARRLDVGGVPDEQIAGELLLLHELREIAAVADGPGVALLGRDSLHRR